MIPKLFILRIGVASVALGYGVALTAVACGGSVYLGGTDEGGAPDGQVVDGGLDAGLEASLLDPCDPCADLGACGAASTCAKIGGPEGFCAWLCPNGNECNGDAGDGVNTCQTVTTVSGASTRACVPQSGRCAEAPGPDAGADAAAPTHCGDLVAPSVSGTPCRSCNPSSSSCQPNGCYGGWWCNTYYKRCEKPPKYCDSD